MASKKPSHPQIAALCALLVAMAPCASFAQAPAGGPEVLNKLWDEAGAAYTAKEFGKASEKLEELLKFAGTSQTGPIEQARFNLGLSYLLSEKYTEAEKAFTDCINQFKKGEYTSRCYLGIGKARIAKAGTDKTAKATAVDPLRLASADPKLRSEAGLALGQLYTDLGREADALQVFRTLMGADIRSPQQTTAAVEVVGVLAQAEKLDELVSYLDRLIRSAGVRDAIAWYTNQVLVTADQLFNDKKFDAALILYRSVLPRTQILDIQRLALDAQRKELKLIEPIAAAEEKKPLGQRTNIAERLANQKAAIETTEKALAEVEEMKDLDSAVLMRRGRSFYYLDRYEEALLGFRTIRLKHTQSKDIKGAAFAEIAVLQKLNRLDDIMALSADYIRKYPDDDKVPQIRELIGQMLVTSGDWKKAGDWYRDLEKDYPKSENLENYLLVQGISLMNDGQFLDAAKKFAELVQKFPGGPQTEAAEYRIVMCYFLTNDSKNTVTAAKAYLEKHPDGQFAGDILYRLAFIDFADKSENRADQILQNLGGYVEKHKEDPALGMMYNLIGDVWAQKKKDTDTVKVQDMALEYYTKALFAPEQSEEITRYALESASSILRAKKDWAGLSKLNGDFLKERPNGPLAMVCVSEIAKAKLREGKPEEAAALLGEALKPRIGDPSSEQAELVIDTLLSTLVPRKVRDLKDEDRKAVADKVADVLKEIVGDRENQTTNARIFYARAKAMDMMKDREKADLFIKGIATATEPEALSPMLLAVCGEVLMKLGDLDKAEAMFTRLSEKFKESFFSDAGPVGLGRIALARKQYEQALKIFDAALENKGNSRVNEALFGRMQALSALNKLDEAEKLGLELVGVKGDKGAVANAYLELANVSRKRAAAAVGQAKQDALNTANGRYLRVRSSYKAYTDQYAQACWGAYEVLGEMNLASEAMDVIRAMAADPRLEKHPLGEKARQMIK